MNTIKKISCKNIFQEGVLKNSICLLFSLLSTFALAYTPAQGDSASTLVQRSISTDSSILALILCASLFSFYKSTFFHRAFRLSRSIIIPSGLFALFMVIGSSFRSVGDWSHDIDSIKGSAILVILFIGYCLLFCACISWIFRILDSGLLCRPITTSNRITRFVFSTHPLVAPWGIILLCWLPFLVAYYPGCVSWDMFGQLKQSFGIWEMTSHHPPLPTFLIGICLKTGRLIGSDNIGIFLYTTLQTAAFSFSLAFSIFYMGKIKAPYWLRWLALLFFALCPLFPGYAQWVVKDTIFTSAMILYIIFIIQLIRKPESILFHPARLLCFIAVIFLVALFRNNGIYLVLLSAPLLLFTLKTKKSRRVLFCTLAGFLVTFVGYSQLLLPSLGIAKGSVAEVLSIPFQQTARYVREHGEEITPEEKAGIEGILDYANLAEIYNPEISDPIKATFRKASTPEEIEAYFNVWVQQFLKHPETYIKATINNVFGYFYPDVCVWEYGGRGFANGTAPDEEGDFHYHNVGGLSGLRSILEGWSTLWYKAPVIRTFYRIGIYTWVIIILASYLLNRKKYRESLILVPCFLLVLICMASPVNRCVRYFLPIIAALPVILAAVICTFQSRKSGM